MEGKARSGETIDIVDHQGKWLARGAYSPSSQIRARVWTFDRNEAIDSAFFERRLKQAQTWRAAGRARWPRQLPPDRRRVRWPAGRHYRPLWQLFVLQLLSAGAEYQRAAIISALQNLFPDCAIYDRSDVAVRKKRDWSWPGAGGGRTAPALLPITEHGMKLLVDIRAGTRPATTSTSVTAAGHPPLCRG